MMVRSAILAAAALGIASSGQSITLRSGGVDVVVDPSAPRTVRFAACEMTNFLSRAFGRPVPIVAAPTAGRVPIVLGDCARTRAAGLNPERLPRDGFEVKVSAEGVFIAGRDDPETDMFGRCRYNGGNSQRFERATTFGVYDFLERSVGVRFYFPGELGEIVPRREFLELAEGRYESHPHFTARLYSHFDSALGEWYETLPKDEWRRATNLEMYRLRMETMHIPCCHGQRQAQLTLRFAKDHPEWFRLGSIGGGKTARRTDYRPDKPDYNSQMCHTSGYWEELYQDAKSYLSGEPASVRKPCMGFVGTGKNRRKDWVWSWNGAYGKYFDVMPADGMFKCICPNCQAAYAKAKDPETQWACELIWGKTAEMARRLTAEGVGGYLTQMAYGSYRAVPDFDLPTNILVMVAESGAWSVPDKEKWLRDNAEIEAWSKKMGGNVWVWNYVGKFECAGTWIPDVPCSTPHAMGRYIKSISPLVFGAYQESSVDRFFFNYLPLYVFSRLAWDPSADPEVILDEHDRLMFGAGAAPMKKYRRIQEFVWLKEIVGRMTDTEIGPKVIPPSEYVLWTKVYDDRRIAALSELLSQAMASVPPNSLEARRIALYRSQTLEPMVRRRDAYLKDFDVAAEVRYRAEHPGRTNILFNGRFEKGIFSWRRNVGKLGEVAWTPEGFGGAGAIRISSRDTSTEISPKTFWRAYSTQVLGERIKPSTRYRLSYFVKLDNVVTTKRRGGVTVAFLNCGLEETLYPKTRLHGTTPWIRQCFEFATSTEVGKEKPPDMRLLMTEAYGTVYFSDVRLDELGPANYWVEGVSPSVSPDGRLLAFSRRDGFTSRVGVCNAADGSAVRWIDGCAGSEGYSVWLPDGSLVYSATASTATAYRAFFDGLPTGCRLRRWKDGVLTDLTDGNFIDYLAAPSSDGRTLWFSTTRAADPSRVAPFGSRLARLDLTSPGSSPVVVASEPNGQNSGFVGASVSPDGRFLVVGQLVHFFSGWRLMGARLEGSKPVAFVPLTPRAMNAHSPCFSPDGRMIAFTGFAEGDSGWGVWVSDFRTGGLRRIADGESPRFSPDGAWLYYERNQRIYRRAFGDADRPPAVAEDPVAADYPPAQIVWNSSADCHDLKVLDFGEDEDFFVRATVGAAECGESCELVKVFYREGEVGFRMAVQDGAAVFSVMSMSGDLCEVRAPIPATGELRLVGLRFDRKIYLSVNGGSAVNGLFKNGRPLSLYRPQKVAVDCAKVEIGRGWATDVPRLGDRRELFR